MAAAARGLAVRSSPLLLRGCTAAVQGCGRRRLGLQGKSKCSSASSSFERRHDGRRWWSSSTARGAPGGPKVCASAAEAVADVPPGATLLVGGFGLTGVPENLLGALQDRGVDDLTVVSSNVGTGERGLGLLFQTNQVRGPAPELPATHAGYAVWQAASA